MKERIFALENLVGKYKHERKLFMKESWYRRLSPFFRMFGASFEHSRLLKLEAELQEEAKSWFAAIVKTNNISNDELKFFSLCLKNHKTKFTERNVFIIIAVILIGLLLGPGEQLLLLITEGDDFLQYFKIFAYTLIVGVLIERHYINSYVSIYEELANLIDDYL